MTSVTNDAALPVLALPHRGRVRAALGALLGRDPGAVVDEELLELKPGRRALLRYETTSAGTVYGKVFADVGDARRTYDVMVRVADAMAGPFTTPRPLGLADDLALLLYEPVTGRPLDSFIATPAMIDGVAAAGRWLAALHGSACRLDRVLDLDHEAENAQVWSSVAGTALPDHARAAARLASAVADAVPVAVTDPVPIHKDFHPQHVFIDGDVGVVDLDEARMGDPLFDVAHFLTNLGLLCHRAGVDQAEQHAWNEAFVDAHGTAADDSRLRWLTAYTCLKLVKQLATGQGPKPRPAGTGRDPQAAWLLDVGLAAVAT